MRPAFCRSRPAFCDCILQFAVILSLISLGGRFGCRPPLAYSTTTPFVVPPCGVSVRSVEDAVEVSPTATKVPSCTSRAFLDAHNSTQSERASSRFRSMGARLAATSRKRAWNNSLHFDSCGDRSVPCVTAVRVTSSVRATALRDSQLHHQHSHKRRSATRAMDSAAAVGSERDDNNAVTATTYRVVASGRADKCVIVLSHFANRRQDARQSANCPMRYPLSTAATKCS